MKYFTKIFFKKEGKEIYLQNYKVKATFCLLLLYFCKYQGVYMDSQNKYKFFLEKSDIGVPGEQIGCKYHYTTIKALRGIVENNNLWVSNAMFLNDKSEIKYAVRFIKKTIRQNTSIANKVIDIIENFINYIVENSDQIFVLSTSSNKDSQLLWSNYSNMDGYCLGFDFSRDWEKLYIKTKNGHKEKLDYKKCIRVDRVIYDVRKQKEFLKEPLQLINQHFKENPEGQLTQFLHYFFHVLMMFKDPKFRHEEEFRIVFVIPEYKKYVQYYVTSGILIPYIEVNFEDRIPLESIKIGPRNDIDVARASIESFLKCKGFADVEVTKSDIPLRF